MRKVIALKFCVSKFTETLKGPRVKVLDKLKSQATEQPVMLTTVTGKSSSKESLEDRLRALVSHTDLEPMARHSERSRLSFGLGQTGADGWIWVIRVSSWVCVYRRPSPDRRCPFQWEEGSQPRTEPSGTHRKLEKNEGMLFSCSNMQFIDKKSS